MPTTNRTAPAEPSPPPPDDPAPPAPKDEALDHSDLIESLQRTLHRGQSILEEAQRTLDEITDLTTRNAHRAPRRKSTPHDAPLSSADRSGVHPKAPGSTAREK